MTNLLNTVLVIILMLNLFILGTSRMNAITRIVAIQGVLMGIIPLLVHKSMTIPIILMAVVAIVLKAIIIPTIIYHALRDSQIKREVEPLVGFLPSIIIGAIATACALLFSSRLPLMNSHYGMLLVPTSVATVLVGFIQLITRYKAISQVIGYLILENGIFIFGMLLVESMPLIVELGVLLDIFVGIFVIGIIVNHINQTFSSMDTRDLVSLKG